MRLVVFWTLGKEQVTDGANSDARAGLTNRRAAVTT